MTDHGTFPPGHGHQWRGDWRARLRDLLTSRGFSSATAFAEARPTVDLVTLANELGGGDVAAVQIQWALLEEATAADGLARCARDLLARRLASVPGGWPGPATDRPYDRSWPLIKALSGWSSALGESHEPTARRITTVLLTRDDLPAGWRPTGADDPVLVDLFRAEWT